MASRSSVTSANFADAIINEELPGSMKEDKKLAYIPTVLFFRTWADARLLEVSAKTRFASRSFQILSNC